MQDRKVTNCSLQQLSAFDLAIRHIGLSSSLSPLRIPGGARRNLALLPIIDVVVAQVGSKTVALLLQIEAAHDAVLNVLPDFSN
jgi:hypothetical protein